MDFRIAEERVQEFESASPGTKCDTATTATAFFVYFEVRNAAEKQ